MIVISTHTVFNKDKDLYSPSHAISIYLNKNQIDHIFIKYSPDGPTVIEYFEEGKRIDVKKKSSATKQGFWQSIQEIVLGVRSSWYDQPLDLFIGVNPSNAITGNILKILGKTKKTVYFSTDFAINRFENPILNSLYHLLDKLAMVWSDQTWSVSKRIVEYRKKNGLAAQKNLFIPNAPFFDEVKRKDLHHIDKHRIVMVSPLEKGIDHRIFIDSIMELRKKIPSISLSIVGSGPEEKTLKKYVESKSISKVVSFLGGLSHDETLNLLTKSAVGLAIHDEYDKTQAGYFSDPMATRDFLAAGLPVLITGNTAVAEEIEKRKAGMKTKVDKNDLVNHLSRILTNQKVYKHMRSNAISLAKESDLYKSLESYISRVLRVQPSYLYNSIIGLATVLILVFLGFGLLFTKYKQADTQASQPTPTPQQLFVQREGKLVSREIGDMTNIFPAGFNRSLCYEPNDSRWWVFYFKSKSEKKPGVIVYKSSRDDGTSWSEEVRLDPASAQTPNFSIDCNGPTISIVYTDAQQSNVFWKRGEMQGDKINWSISNTALQTSKSLTRTQPSLVYWNGIPVISAQDKNEKGIMRSYITIAQDAEGHSWIPEMKVFEASLSNDEEAVGSLSLQSASGRLFALVNRERDKMFITEYLGDTFWSEIVEIPGLLYEGDSAEWSTFTDDNGLLHIFYPEKETRKVQQATFDGYNWYFDTTPLTASEPRQIASVYGEGGTFVALSESLALSEFNGVQWSEKQNLLKESKPPVMKVTATQRTVNGKLGISWLDGDQNDSVLWFLCLQRDADSAGIFHECQ